MNPFDALAFLRSRLGRNGTEDPRVDLMCEGCARTVSIDLRRLPADYLSDGLICGQCGAAGFTLSGALNAAQDGLRQASEGVAQGLKRGGAVIQTGLTSAQQGAVSTAFSALALTRDAAEHIVRLYAQQIDERALVAAKAEWALHHASPWDEAEAHRRDALIDRHRRILNDQLLASLLGAGAGPAARALRLPLPL